MKRPAGELRHDTLDGLAHVPFDATLDALGHVQRRELLFVLLDDTGDGPPVVLADPAGEVDTPEHRVVMDYVHLRKLAERGFIDWSRDANEVTKGPDFDGIKPLLELLSDHEDELPDGW